MLVAVDEPEQGADHLLVDPVLLAALPVAELGGLEPESNLLVGGLNGVGAVANVATNLGQES